MDLHPIQLSQLHFPSATERFHFLLQFILLCLAKELSHLALCALLVFAFSVPHILAKRQTRMVKSTRNTIL